MDRVHIPRYVRSGPHPSIEPGKWYVDRDGNLWAKCPECKKGAVMEEHAIAPDGTVSPSIACFAPCGYHVWGVLDGWIYGEKKAGERVSFTADTCPDHVASDSDPKVCGRCGVHVAELQ